MTVWSRLAAQDRQGQERSALITDVDNTFYRHGDASAIRAAQQLAAHAPYPIIAATGDTYTALYGRIQTGELPAFDALATSVGTEIWFLDETGKYTRDDAYHKLLAARGYKRPRVITAAQSLVATLKERGVRIEFQPKTKEPYKVSLYFFAPDARTIREVTAAFKERFSQQNIVVCEEINHNAKLGPKNRHKKYCLDILAATKADAASYLAERLALRRGVVAGDSGNDADMLLRAPEGFVAVAVGGHKPELAAALRAAKKSKNTIIDTSERRAAQSLLLFDGYLRGATLTWPTQ